MKRSVKLRAQFDRGGYRPMIETLEDRQVMAGDPLPFDFVANKTGADAKLDFELAQLSADYASAMEEFGAFDAFPAAHSDGIMVQGRNVGVQIGAKSDLETLRADLQTIGFQETNWAGQVVAGWLPVESLQLATEFASVRFLRFVAAPTYHGTANQDGDASLLGPTARATPPNPDGSGVTIGVISDSFNSSGNPAVVTADEAADNLPGPANPAGYLTPVNVLLDDTPGTDEGRAMLQIVHAVAPGADLAFHSAFNSPGVIDQTIATAIDALAAVPGMNVIVDDVSILTAPFFQDGFAAQSANAAVNSGIAYFSSAGNDARQSYESQYRNFVVNDGSIFDGYSVMDFDPGAGIDYKQQITIPTGTSFRFTLEWDQPYFSITPATGGSDNDVDFYILDHTGTIVGGSADFNIGSDPYEFSGFTNNGSYGSNEFDIVILTFDGPNPGLVKYIFAGGNRITIDEYATASSTTFGQANASGVAAVGAVNYLNTPVNGVATPIIERFSSAGGTPILFDVNGNRLATPEIRQQPRFSAPDGVFTTVPGFFAFFGTSAAAPQAAAVAALIINANGGAISPTQLYAAMAASAIDMDDPATVGFDYGFDWGTGYGFIQAPSSVSASVIPANSIFLIDVSRSMNTYFGDVNRDGIVNDLDDLNHDGVDGTVLDGAIQAVLNQQALTGANVAIGILGANAQFLDMSSAPGFQSTVNRTIGAGDADFQAVLFSVRIGQGGFFDKSTVDPNATFYAPGLAAMQSLAGTLAGSITADVITDGSGRLPDTTINNPLAGITIIVDVTILGPYQSIGSTSDAAFIATGNPNPALQGTVVRQITPQAPSVLNPGGATTPNLTMVNPGAGSLTRAISVGDLPTPSASMTRSFASSPSTSGTITTRSRRYPTNSGAIEPELVDAVLEDVEEIA